MKLKLSYLLAAAAFSTALGAYAQETKPERPSREEMREKFKNMTPEEREKAIKEWRAKQGGAQADGRRPDMEHVAKQLGLNPDDLRNLTPDERRAKFQEASEKKLAELNKKKADKTITEEESEFLKRLEARKKYGERSKDGPPRGDDKPGKDGHGHKEGKGPGEKGDKPGSKK